MTNDLRFYGENLTKMNVVTQERMHDFAETKETITMESSVDDICKPLVR